MQLKKHTCKKKTEHKDFLEWYVVEQACLYVLAPERIKHISENVARAYDIEFSEDNTKELEKLLKQYQKDFDKLTNSLLDAKSQRMIDSINERAEALDALMSETEEEISKLKIAQKAKLTAEDVNKELHRRCNGYGFQKENP